MTDILNSYLLSCHTQNYQSTSTGAQSKYADPSFTKKNIAKIKSRTGNTTLFTTDLICVLAVVHVLSTAPATSPAANAGIANTAVMIKIANTAIKILFVFIIVYLQI